MPVRRILADGDRRFRVGALGTQTVLPDLADQALGLDVGHALFLETTVKQDHIVDPPDRQQSLEKVDTLARRLDEVGDLESVRGPQEGLRGEPPSSGGACRILAGARSWRKIDRRCRSRIILRCPGVRGQASGPSFTRSCHQIEVISPSGRMYRRFASREDFRGASRIRVLPADGPHDTMRADYLPFSCSVILKPPYDTGACGNRGPCRGTF